MAAEVVPVEPGQGDERDLDHLHQRRWNARKKYGEEEQVLTCKLQLIARGLFFSPQWHLGQVGPKKLVCFLKEDFFPV